MAKAWIMSFIVIFWLIELSLKVSLSSIVVGEEDEEEDDVNEFKIESKGISV